MNSQWVNTRHLDNETMYFAIHADAPNNFKVVLYNEESFEVIECRDWCYGSEKFGKAHWQVYYSSIWGEESGIMEGIMLQYSHWDTRDVKVTELINL